VLHFGVRILATIVIYDFRKFSLTVIGINLILIWYGRMQRPSARHRPRTTRIGLPGQTMTGTPRAAKRKRGWLTTVQLPCQQPAACHRLPIPNTVRALQMRVFRVVMSKVVGFDYSLHTSTHRSTIRWFQFVSR
jgi:hypothetical protein